MAFLAGVVFTALALLVFALITLSAVCYKMNDYDE